MSSDLDPAVRARLEAVGLLGMYAQEGPALRDDIRAALAALDAATEARDRERRAAVVAAARAWAEARVTARNEPDPCEWWPSRRRALAADDALEAAVAALPAEDEKGPGETDSPGPT